MSISTLIDTANYGKSKYVQSAGALQGQEGIDKCEEEVIGVKWAGPYLTLVDQARMLGRFMLA